MSGITPILDTLVHHVLGRRRGMVSRLLRGKPLLPAAPSRPSREVHSDSRLDARVTDSASRAKGGAVASARSGSVASPRAGRAPTVASPVAQSRAQLSRAGRMLADVQWRASDQPSVLQPARPLVAMAERLDAALLAMALRQTIEASGLFYEAHLRRWHDGKFARARLAREPQMAWTRGSGAAIVAASVPEETPLRTPARTTSGDTDARVRDGAGSRASEPAGPTITTTTATPGQARTYGADGRPLPLALAEQVSAAAASPEDSRAADLRQPRGLHPALESTLRHQLELLSTPVLRWQGQPWAGVFMALLMVPPHHHDNGAEHDHGHAPHDSGSESSWCSKLTFGLAHLGEVTVDLRLSPKRIALDMQAIPTTASRLREGLPALRERLATLDCADVSVRVQAR